MRDLAGPRLLHGGGRAKRYNRMLGYEYLWSTALIEGACLLGGRSPVNRFFTAESAGISSRVDVSPSGELNR